MNTIVIGAGQAGLATGRHLQQLGEEFLILDGNAQVGDQWRSHWDSLRLYSPAKYDGLPGLPFPGDPWHYPGKDEVADYLASYAAHFELPIRHNTRVDRLERIDDQWIVSTGGEQLTAGNVVVATGTFGRTPYLPDCAVDLDPAIRQLHSSEYRRPEQLKDGPVLGRWVERHMGLPLPVAHTVTGRTTGSLRGYFRGVTAVALFNGVVIGLGALVLGVPLAGSIAVVNFVGAYIPYLGAWTAGGFTFLIALGSQGPETALAMAVVMLLANGVLQQMIQPIAYGAALGIHPLAVLIVTIAGGCLFGMVGLVLAAPLTSAAVKISADLSRARALEHPAPP